MTDQHQISPYSTYQYKSREKVMRIKDVVNKEFHVKQLLYFKGLTAMATNMLQNNKV